MLFIEEGLERNDEFTGTGIKTECYFFASAPVTAYTVDLDLDFDFWANCWLYNSSKSNLPKVGLKNLPVSEPESLGEQWIFLQFKN